MRKKEEVNEEGVSKFRTVIFKLLLLNSPQNNSEKINNIKITIKYYLFPKLPFKKLNQPYKFFFTLNPKN